LVASAAKKTAIQPIARVMERVNMRSGQQAEMNRNRESEQRRRTNHRSLVAGMVKLYNN
jgi:hypothetical protein